MTQLMLTALLSVTIHNIADVPEIALTRAKTEVERIYAGAGVKIAWVTASEHPGDSIHVTVQRQPAGGLGAISPFVLGTTVGGNHSRGGSSFVFYERVLNFALKHQRSVELVLAFAIAHEMGHVLLPAPAHTPRGLMKAEWDDNDIRLLTVGARPFTPIQVTLMNAAIEGYQLSAAK